MTDDARAELWVPVLFKGQRVFARADAQGRPAVRGGMVDIRYRVDAPRVYRGAARNLEALGAAEAAVVMAPPVESPPARGLGVGAKSLKARKAGDHSVAPPRGGAAVAYTDGACSGNPGPAGFGVVIDRPEARTELSVFLGRATNNIAELSAIEEALLVLRDWRGPIDVYTDSNYAIGVLTKAWKPKANQDLIAGIKELLPTGRDVRFVWVPGHAGVELNERADELARLAIEAQKDSRVDTPKSG